MKKLVSVLLSAVVLIPQCVAAVDFKTYSILSTGKWVKIKTVKSGIYELSYDELREFGFQHPENVKVFGTGGNVASENYLYDYMDDLEQTPVMHHSGKIYFYAKGVVRDSITVAGTTYMYRPITNPYTRSGAYFLSDISSEAPLLVEDVDYTDGLDAVRSFKDTGTAVWYDEKELYNPGLTGQTFLGDNILVDKNITYNVPVPEISDAGTFYAAASSALMSDMDMYLSIFADGKELVLDSGSNMLLANSDVDYLEYGTLTVRAQSDMGSIEAADGKVELKVSVETAGNLSKAWMDFASVTYPAYNRIPEDSAQTRRYIPLSNNHGIKVYPSSDGFMVWKVDEFGANSELPFKVENCVFKPDADGGDGGLFFEKGSSDWAEYVLFDTNREQLHPEYAGVVENQNLHSMQVPDMLIITNENLMSQAERLADFHRQYDGMDVAVVDQELVFNEFSSGVRDAMAYRRLCKMLYDRNPEKFQYLLLFGPGTYDNRMLYTGEDTKQLITYQSKSGDSQVRSYSTDDFFGFLDDSNTSYVSRQMKISVGRIPFGTEKEMACYVDKLIAYMTDLGNSGIAWKNNMLLIAESGDDDVHVSQCESFMHYFNDTGNYDMNISKLYLKAFSEQENVRDKFVADMNIGQNFVLYVGHGNPYSLTKSQIIMTLDDAGSTHYKYAPIMYFSTCDVARYDRGGANLVESLLSNQSGGIISAVASSRVVYTNLNGKLSDAFAKSLSKADVYYDGDKTLGKVLTDAKNLSGEKTINRLKYHLLGDPAMRIKFPDNGLSLTSANGEPLVDGVTVDVPFMEPVRIEGTIDLEDGTIDETFDGKAVLRMYDPDSYYTTAKVTVDNVSDDSKEITQRGDMLNEIELDVSAGKFSGEIIFPEFAKTNKGVIPIRIISVSDDGRIVSGTCKSVSVDRKLLTSSLLDLQSPEIKSFYIDDKDTFKEGMSVGPDFYLYAEVTDNFGINSSSETIVSSIYFSFDNGNIVVPVSGGYMPVGNRGGLIEVPVYSMVEGRHTVELVVADLSGNTKRKVLSFYVENPAEGVFVKCNEKASSEYFEFDVEAADGGQLDYSSAEIFVTDNRGNVSLRDDIDSFPYEWDLTDTTGGKVVPGVYTVTIVLDKFSLPSEKIVVLEQ